MSTVGSAMWVDIMKGPSEPSVKRIAAALGKHLEKLDWNQVRADQASGNMLGSKFEWQQDGWRILIDCLAIRVTGLGSRLLVRSETAACPAVRIAFVSLWSTSLVITQS